MKRLIFFVLFIVLIRVASAVTWNVVLFDEASNGWQGGTLTVYVNGIVVLDHITHPPYIGGTPHLISINNGDQISTLYVPGVNPGENVYRIFNHLDQLILAQGLGWGVPSSIISPITAVVVGAPEVVTNPSPASGTLNHALEGEVSWTFGADSETYDLWFGPTGSMEQVVTGATVGATGSYSFAGLNSYTQYSWQVVTHNANWTTNTPAFNFTTVFGTGYVEIGEGTTVQFYPFSATKGYTSSMSLYPSSQIGLAGLLDEVSWNVATTASTPVPYKIYAKMVTEESLTSQTWDSFVASATLVKEGTYAFTTTGWHNFVLSTPFVYTGGSLVIGVEGNIGGFGISYPPFFYYTQTPANTHQIWASDVYSSSAYPGYPNNWRPNIKLHLSALAGDPNLAITPPSWNFGGVSIGGSETKEFRLTNNGGGIVNVSNISLTGDYYSLLVNPAPVALGSNQFSSFTVQYNPLVAGYHIGNVAITDGRSRTVTNIPLTGNAAIMVNIQNGSSSLAIGETRNFFDSGGPAAPYQNNEDLSYTFYPPAGYLVKAEFYSYSSEANRDYLRVINGLNNTYPEIAAYSGMGLTIPAYTSCDASGALTFRFTSDSNNTRAGWEAVISLDIEEAASPNPPVLSLPVSGATAVSLIPSFSWTRSATGTTPTQYKVYLSTANPPVSLVATVTDPSYIPASALSTGTVYYWKVVAVNATGESGDSEIRSFSTMVLPPSGLTAAAEVNRISLNWTAPADAHIPPKF